jgi:hypothetical protein
LECVLIRTGDHLWLEEKRSEMQQPKIPGVIRFDDLPSDYSPTD